MSSEGHFTIELEQQEDYAFRVAFDWGSAPDLLLDEPNPLGAQQGPNAARLLAAAAANCLSASLLYCISRKDTPSHAIRAHATCELVRNEKKRLRVGRLKVQLIVSDVLHQSKRLPRCLDLYEDFCVVSDSIRKGIPIDVEVVNEQGEVLA